MSGQTADKWQFVQNVADENSMCFPAAGGLGTLRATGGTKEEPISEEYKIDEPLYSTIVQQVTSGGIGVGNERAFESPVCTNADSSPVYPPRPSDQPYARYVDCTALKQPRIIENPQYDQVAIALVLFGPPREFIPVPANASILCFCGLPLGYKETTTPSHWHRTCSNPFFCCGQGSGYDEAYEIADPLEKNYYYKHDIKVPQGEIKNAYNQLTKDRRGGIKVEANRLYPSAPAGVAVPETGLGAFWSGISVNTDGKNLLPGEPPAHALWRRLTRFLPGVHPFPETFEVYLQHTTCAFETFEAMCNKLELTDTSEALLCAVFSDADLLELVQNGRHPVSVPFKGKTATLMFAPAGEYRYYLRGAICRVFDVERISQRLYRHVDPDGVPRFPCVLVTEDASSVSWYDKTRVVLAMSIFPTALIGYADYQDLFTAVSHKPVKLFGSSDYIKCINKDTCEWKTSKGSIDDIEVALKTWAADKQLIGNIVQQNGMSMVKWYPPLPGAGTIVTGNIKVMTASSWSTVLVSPTDLDAIVEKPSKTPLGSLAFDASDFARFTKDYKTVNAASEFAKPTRSLTVDLQNLDGVNNVLNTVPQNINAARKITKLAGAMTLKKPTPPPNMNLPVNKFPTPADFAALGIPSASDVYFDLVNSPGNTERDPKLVLSRWKRTPRAPDGATIAEKHVMELSDDERSQLAIGGIDQWPFPQQDITIKEAFEQLGGLASASDSPNFKKLAALLPLMQTGATGDTKITKAEFDIACANSRETFTISRTPPPLPLNPEIWQPRILLPEIKKYGFMFLAGDVDMDELLVEETTFTSLSPDAAPGWRVVTSFLWPSSDSAGAGVQAYIVKAKRVAIRNMYEALSEHGQRAALRLYKQARSVPSKYCKLETELKRNAVPGTEDNQLANVLKLFTINPDVLTAFYDKLNELDPEAEPPNFEFFFTFANDEMHDEIKALLKTVLRGRAEITDAYNEFKTNWDSYNTLLTTYNLATEDLEPYDKYRTGPRVPNSSRVSVLEQKIALCKTPYEISLLLGPSDALTTGATYYTDENGKYVVNSPGAENTIDAYVVKIGGHKTVLEKPKFDLLQTAIETERDAAVIRNSAFLEANKEAIAVLGKLLDNPQRPGDIVDTNNLFYGAKFRMKVVGGKVADITVQLNRPMPPYMNKRLNWRHNNDPVEVNFIEKGTDPNFDDEDVVTVTPPPPFKICSAVHRSREEALDALWSTPASHTFYCDHKDESYVISTSGVQISDTFESISFTFAPTGLITSAKEPRNPGSGYDASVWAHGFIFAEGTFLPQTVIETSDSSETKLSGRHDPLSTQEVTVVRQVDKLPEIADIVTSYKRLTPEQQTMLAEIQIAATTAVVRTNDAQTDVEAVLKTYSQNPPPVYCFGSHPTIESMKTIHEGQYDDMFALIHDAVPSAPRNVLGNGKFVVITFNEKPSLVYVPAYDQDGKRFSLLTTREKYRSVFLSNPYRSSELTVHTARVTPELKKLNQDDEITILSGDVYTVAARDAGDVLTITTTDSFPHAFVFVSGGRQYQAIKIKNVLATNKVMFTYSRVGTDVPIADGVNPPPREYTDTNWNNVFPEKVYTEDMFKTYQLANVPFERQRNRVDGSIIATMYAEQNYPVVFEAAFFAISQQVFSASFFDDETKYEQIREAHVAADDVREMFPGRFDGANSDWANEYFYLVARRDYPPNLAEFKASSGDFAPADIGAAPDEPYDVSAARTLNFYTAGTSPIIAPAATPLVLFLFHVVSAVCGFGGYIDPQSGEERTQTNFMLNWTFKVFSLSIPILSLYRNQDVSATVLATSKFISDVERKVYLGVSAAVGGIMFLIYLLSFVPRSATSLNSLKAHVGVRMKVRGPFSVNEQSRESHKYYCISGYHKPVPRP